MSLQIQIINSPIAQLAFSEAGGIGKLALTAAASVGGGSTAGVVQFKNTTEVDVSAIQLVDAGLKLAAAKLPQFAAEIALIQAAVDAEVAKL
jgi:hypothetical protein